MNVTVPAVQRREGRPCKLSPEVTEKLIGALRKGSFIKPACGAAGISYQTVRTWIQRAEDDQKEGKETEFTEFRDALTRARDESEVNAASRVAEDPDWRASAFLLERGFRERWGRDDKSAATGVNVLVLSEKASEIAVELLRMLTNAQPGQPAIETTATTEEDHNI